jgi:outer membrane protein TolC
MQRLKEVFLSIQYNVKLAEAYRHKVTSTDIQLKAVTKGHAIGTRSLGDLLQAEHAAAVSHRDLQHALYDNIQLRIELRAAAGILAISDFVEISQHVPIAAVPESP